MPREYVEVAVEEIVKETENAFLCRIDDEEVWLPKSQVYEPEDFHEGDVEVLMEITEWIANEKGIET